MVQTVDLDHALGVKNVLVKSNNIAPGTIIASDILDDSLTNAKIKSDAAIVATKLAIGNADEVLKTNTGGTANEFGKLQGANFSVFQSAEITGTGAEADTAHGLGRTPVVVIVYPTENTTGNTLDLAEGVHDGTNIKVNAPITCKYKIVAF